MATIRNASRLKESSSPRYREWLAFPQFSWRMERVGPCSVKLEIGVSIISCLGRLRGHSIGSY